MRCREELRHEGARDWEKKWGKELMVYISGVVSLLLCEKNCVISNVYDAFCSLGRQRRPSGAYVRS